jgi:hypothetical protein
MTYIYSVTHIRQPIQPLFDYITTPANWPHWHPSSLKVNGTADHPLQVGEQIIEEFLVAGRYGQVVWTVRDCLPPHRWVIEGEIIGSRSGGIITYTLTPRLESVTFEREFTYTLSNPFLDLLDWLLLRRRIQAESDEALRRLKTVLEQNEGISTRRPQEGPLLLAELVF